MADRTKAKVGQSIKDRLSRLAYRQACQALGPDGQRLVDDALRTLDVDLDTDVYLGTDLFRVRVNDYSAPGEQATATISIDGGRNRELRLACDRCELPCEHLGVALAIVLSEKTALGLAAPPDESVPTELLTEEEAVARALDERRQRAASEPMTLRSLDPMTPWADYVLISRASGKSYQVALRGREPGRSHCSCPDFRVNRLGTCKHVLYALDRARKRFGEKALSQPYQPREIGVRLPFDDPSGVRFEIPQDADDRTRKSIGAYETATLRDAGEALRLIKRLRRGDRDVVVYPDAEDWIERELQQAKLRAFAADVRRDPAGHPLRTSLLKVDLLPYQMEGIAFVVGAGRALLADDMGLGKTIQAIGVAEALAREVGIGRTLVICPASLKSQWRDEIRRFSDRRATIVLGKGKERAAQYADDSFFTICNYEQALRDLTTIETIDWDLIVLDEGQRIKNWESKTSQTIRSLKSRFALVLTGTPLENRLDELFTVAKFVDDRLLGPAYEFFRRHRVVDDRGRVEGFRNLDEVREKLRPILLRRTRDQVLGELPERTVTVCRVAPAQEQVDLHASSMQTVVRITRKRFLTEIDLLQLQRALLMCRMAADSTVLVDKEEPGYSTKLDRLAELLEELAESPDRKIVLFSEWTRMLDLIEPLFERVGMDYVRLDGQVPQSRRAEIVRRFQQEPDCRAILMTNAGSTGLNLQAADVVINVDLPWNPAVLEQRIARAHRMGQQRPVQVYLLVTEETLEERLLDTLAMKQDLALAVLDPDSDVDEVRFESGMEELRRRLERLLGAPPEAPVDESQRRRVEVEAEAASQRRERVASAGGELLGAALGLVGELLADPGRPAPDPQVAERLERNLADCIERDAAGRPLLRVTLPDDAALKRLAGTLAKLLVADPAVGSTSG